jgi:hypothetical protein
MNEIELLWRFREGVPDPDEATERAARAILMERIEAPRGRPRLRGPVPGRRIALGLTATTAALVVVTLVVSILLPRGGTSAAAGELRRFASVAAQQPAPEPLGTGQYYYLQIEGIESFTGVFLRNGGSVAYTVLIPTLREYWVGRDGSGRLVDTPGKRIWPSPRDKARWEAEGGMPITDGSDQTYGPGQLVGSELDGGEFAALPGGYDFQTLPRAPKALYEAIRSAAGEREPRAPGELPHPRPLGTFALCIELLHTPLTPPDVRAALFEAMTYIPGITVVPQKTIQGIGTGAAVFVEVIMGEVRIRHEYLVDPTTSELLGYQETQLDRAWWIDVDPPFVTTSIAYSKPEVVDSTTERP